jgi:hypothetical protein
MRESQWAALAKATEGVASKMTAQAIAMTLNALCRMEPAAAAMSKEGWRGLARQAESVALKMNALDVAMTLNAFAKMQPAADEMSPAAWDVMARAVHDTVGGCTR